MRAICWLVWIECEISLQAHVFQPLVPSWGCHRERLGGFGGRNDTSLEELGHWKQAFAQFLFALLPGCGGNGTSWLPVPAFLTCSHFFSYWRHTEPADPRARVSLFSLKLLLSGHFITATGELTNRVAGALRRRGAWQGLFRRVPAALTLESHMVPLCLCIQCQKHPF